MKALSQMFLQIFRVRVTPLRLALAALIVAGLTLAFTSATSVAAAGRTGHTGQALALRASLKHGSPDAAAAQGVRRFVYNASMPLVTRVRSAAGVKALAAGGVQAMAGGVMAAVQVSEPVQTFDIFAPNPAFTPSNGPLTPENRTPIFTSDQANGDKYLIFSSNRPHADVNGAIVNDGTFHLWSILARGDNPNLDSRSLAQITTSTGSEFFPTFNPNNNKELAFTSTAAGRIDGNGQPIADLYALDTFSPGVTQVNVNSLVNTPMSLTIRDTPGDPNNTNLNTGFDQVQRPAWSPSGTVIAFSARDTGGANPGKFHIYFLYLSSLGGLNTTQPSPTNPPLKFTDGAGSDTDPAWSPDGTVIAFASTATAITSTATAPAVTSAPQANRSLFRISSAGTNGTPLTITGADDFGPAWDSASSQLAFARGTAPAAAHDIYTVTPGSTATLLNTADNAGQTSTAGNQYDDIYPTLSQSSTVAYASNRSITYNDPTTGGALELAVSLAGAPTGSAAPAAGYTVGTGYFGILVSRLDNVDPPTLLPFSSGEVIHVTQARNGQEATVRGDATAGNRVRFTVRLSNRETGVDDKNVYIQIKDPDSKYQDAQSIEHKVFARDFTDDSAANTAGVDVDSGSALTYLYNGGFNPPNFVNDALSPNNRQYTEGSYLQHFQFNADPNNTFYQYDSEVRGEIGGSDGGVPIAVGHVDPANAGANPVTYQTDANNAGTRIPLAGPDPANFTVLGQEYECQFLNAQFGINGNANGSPDTVRTDYGRPFYLAGVDDQRSHGAAFFGQPRSEWLHLHPVATDTNGNAVPDPSGGVLYTADWITPTSVSDYYLDVIAYDKATFTSFPAATTTAGSPAFGSNFRIYDNVWGFSTQAFTSNNDLLVVSDNALGQKFVGTTFGGSGLNNILTSFYGTESYFTGIDVNLLPNAIFRYVQLGGKKPQRPDMNGVAQNVTPDARPLAQVLGISSTYEAANFSFRTTTPIVGTIPVLNGLGFGSYDPNTQQYNLWRILCRGAVPQAVLNRYQPGFENQPAVNDPTAQITAPAATVPVANRCVLWFSPYAGNLPLNVVGSIADANTQASLRTFVNNGGRLMVSGQSIAATLSAGGVVDPTLNAPGSFLVDILNAMYVPGFNSNPGSENLSGGGARITGDSFFNPDAGRGLVQNFGTSATGNGGIFNYSTPSSSALILGNNYIERPLARTDLWRTDGSLSQLGPALSFFGFNGNVAESQIGIIQPQNGATTDINIVGPGTVDTPGTGPGLVYRPAMNANGGRVVFSSVGLEGIGIEYYKATFNDPTQNNIAQDYYYPRNQRPNILHNIVNYLRTGTVTGNITQAGSGGSPVAGATVYLFPDAGVNIPGYPRKLYSATTAGDGSYQIHGVEPGGYIVHAYKAGFQAAQSLTFVIVSGNGTDTLSLNLTKVTPGNISGKVVDQTGRGVGGASLTFTTLDGQSTATGTTNVDGTYTINNVTPGAYNGTATKVGFTVAAPTGGNPFPGPDGTVPDATGNPPNVRSGSTTPGVNFAIAPVPGALGGLVFSSSDNKALAGATIAITTPTGGAVTDIQGNPVGPITTTATTTSPIAPTGDGNPINYSNTQLSAGTYKVTLTPPPGFSNPTPASPQTVTVTAGAFTRLNFSLPTGTLLGLVTNSATGAPLAGATVTVMSGPTTVATFTTTATAVTNYTGPVPAGTYTVTISASNFFTQTFPNVTVTANASIRQDAALVSSLGTLAGLVTDSFTKQPLGSATVVVQDSSNTTVATFTADANGGTTPTTNGATGDGSPINYGPSTLPQGTYSVTASATDHTTQTLSVVVTAGQFKRQDIALVSTLGTVGGLVVDSITGQPLDGATVTITDAGGATVYTTTTTATPAASPTDTRFGDGKPVSYSKTLTQGVYTVSVSKTDPNSPNSTAQNYIPTTFKVTVAPNTFLRKDVALMNANGTLGGLITDSFTKQPIIGASVTILDSDGNTVKSLTTRAVPISPAAPTGDGSPINYSATLLQGDYTVTVSAPDHTTQGPTKVSVLGSQFKRLDFALVSTLGTLGGIVKDSYSGQNLPGVTVTVKDSANKTAATFTTSATLTSPSAPSGDGQPLNYSGILTQGTYTVTISRPGFATAPAQTVTVTPNAFVRLDFIGAAGLPPQHVFPAGLNFVSFPYDYAAASVTFDALFGTLNSAPRSNPSAGGNRSHVYVWQPQLLQYIVDPAPPADAPRLGQGYWVYLIKPSEATVPGNPATGSSVVMPLNRGWNMIGVPNLSAIGVSALTFNNLASGGTLTFDQAVGSAFKLVSPTLYGFDGTNYVPVTAGGSLQPYQSYWIYAYATTSVNLPTGQ